MSSFPVPLATPSHIQESQRFQEAFRTIRDGLTRLLQTDEKLVLYYVIGEPIAVYHIQIANDALLLLYGNDASGNKTYAVTQISNANFIFKILKKVGDEKRKPIGFSTTPPDPPRE